MIYCIMRYSGVCGCGSHFELNIFRASFGSPRANVPHMDQAEAGSRQLTEDEMKEKALRELQFQCPICHLRNVIITKDRN